MSEKKKSNGTYKGEFVFHAPLVRKIPIEELVLEVRLKKWGFKLFGWNVRVSATKSKRIN